ncbi:MAG TPA: hypothetical protein DCG47_04300 [Spirochaetaceae bacterium]|jgi:bifunctional DNase/RNase|nr:hypothetical protein [Spirochaetaceae bacterium]
MNEEMLPVRVKGVAMPSDESLPVVVLGSVSGTIAVSVGAYEAGAIIMQLEGLSPARPLTHQLLAAFIEEQGFSLKRAELYGVYGYEEDSFLARIVYGKGLKRWTRDVRPSDAIALALALKAPLFAHSSLVCQGAEDNLEMNLSGEESTAYWCQESRAL